jgi:hypothetical protein
VGPANLDGTDKLSVVDALPLVTFAGVLQADQGYLMGQPVAKHRTASVRLMAA